MAKVWLVMGLCVLLCSTVYGAQEASLEPVEGDGLTLTAVGSDDLLSLRVGLRPWSGRTEVGVFGLYLDGLREADDPRAGGGVYGTYDLVDEAEMTILRLQVPVVWYVGVELGALDMPAGRIDATASLLTGLTFGDGRNQIIVEARYAPGPKLWEELADLEEDDRARLVVGVSHRF